MNTQPDCDSVMLSIETTDVAGEIEQYLKLYPGHDLILVDKRDLARWVIALDLQRSKHEQRTQTVSGQPHQGSGESAGETGVGD